MVRVTVDKCTNEENRRPLKGFFPFLGFGDFYFKNLASVSPSFYLFIYLGRHPLHMEVPRLGVKSEL